MHPGSNLCAFSQEISNVTPFRRATPSIEEEQYESKEKELGSYNKLNSELRTEEHHPSNLTL